MKTREQLKGEVEDIREELQREYHWPRMRRLIRELEVKRRAIRCHEIMMGLGLMLAIALVGCDPPDDGPETPVPSEDSSAWVETMKANVSAYCPCERCCGKWASRGVNAAGERVTSSQHVIRPGDKFVAADRRFAFGTLLSIPGYSHGNPVPVLDRGGAIKGNKLDVYFPTHKQALQWGRQYLTVSFERKEQ